jgi:hypothetical protein
MTTNGITFQVEQIPHSKCYKPFEISDIILSRDNSKLIAYQTMEDDDTMLSIKIFDYDFEKNNFYIVSEDEHGSMSNKPKNFALSENGSLFDITVEVIGSKSNKQR